MRVRSGDAEIAYTVLGQGPDVVLLHPFPAHHGVWQPVGELLSTRYRVILPDLRGLGESGTGEGPATMEKHALDIARVCDDAGVGKAIFGGESIGGYILFEFWRRFCERVRGLILANTRTGADSDEGRANRLRSAEEVEKRGVDPFVENMLPKLLGKTTQTNRPDLVAQARAMMVKATPKGIAAVQRGMAQRPDSMATLATISVPVLVLHGGEDVLIPVAEAEQMHRNVRGSELRVIPQAGHFAVYERAEEAGGLIRKFLDRCA